MGSLLVLDCTLYILECGLCEAIRRAMYCAYLCYDIIVELRLGYMTSGVAAHTAQGTGLDYCRIRCTDKILHMIR